MNKTFPLYESIGLIGNLIFSAFIKMAEDRSIYLNEEEKETNLPPGQVNMKNVLVLC